jgi:hypothetical protein
VETQESSKREVEFTELSWVDVLMLFDMIFQIVWASGLYPKPTQVSRMMYDALVGKLVFWLIFTREDGVILPFGLLGTQMYYMPYTGKRVCSVIHGNKVGDFDIDDTQWQKAYKKIIKYAKENGCDKFEVFSDNDRVRDILTAFGFKPSGLYVKEL